MTRRCQYGVTSIACGGRAVTKRRRPSGGTWDVCQRHADILDRLAERMRSDKPLLDRLAKDGR